MYLPSLSHRSPPAKRFPGRHRLSFPKGADAQHYLGSHWDPFVEDSKELMGRLPEIVPNALVQTGYGESRKPAIVTGRLAQGVSAGLATACARDGIDSPCRERGEHDRQPLPFFATGSQHTLTLREVSVWDGGLEAQITASWGEGEVTFFDTQYLINRAWYETGKDYDFIFSGMAYNAGPAEKHEWKINRNPDEVAWMNQRLKEGEEPHETACTMSMDGAAMFLPVSGWDVDDYSFHAPVKSVTEFKDWLGQDGWRVRATVMRFGDEDADLDIPDYPACLVR